MIATALLAGTLFTMVASADLTGDGKKEQLWVRVYPNARVDVRDLNKQPLYDVEVIVKISGAFKTAGTIRECSEFRPVNHFLITDHPSGRKRGFAIFKARSPSGERYWAVGKAVELFPIPKELMEE